MLRPNTNNADSQQMKRLMAYIGRPLPMIPPSPKLDGQLRDDSDCAVHNRAARAINNDTDPQMKDFEYVRLVTCREPNAFQCANTNCPNHA